VGDARRRRADGHRPRECENPAPPSVFLQYYYYVPGTTPQEILVNNPGMSFGQTPSHVFADGTLKYTGRGAGTDGPAFTINLLPSFGKGFTFTLW